jgi:hypothetical protein
MGAAGKERALDRIAELARRGQDLVTFWLETTEALETAVPYYWAPCWYTLDPASLLITSRHHGGVPEYPREWLEAEYYDDDVNRLADVARSERGISTLHEATGGDPTSSPRWHRHMKLGGDQELIASLRTGAGAVWGALGLYREPGSRCSIATSSRSSRRPPPIWQGGRERGCWSARRESPNGPIRRASS